VGRCRCLCTPNSRESNHDVCRFRALYCRNIPLSGVEQYGHIHFTLMIEGSTDELRPQDSPCETSIFIDTCSTNAVRVAVGWCSGGPPISFAASTLPPSRRSGCGSRCRPNWRFSRRERNRSGPVFVAFKMITTWCDYLVNDTCTYPSVRIPVAYPCQLLFLLGTPDSKIDTARPSTEVMAT